MSMKDLLQLNNNIILIELNDCELERGSLTHIETHQLTPIDTNFMETSNNFLALINEISQKKSEKTQTPRNSLI